jgi:phosphoribosylformylglycinamidine cyclo-ligase
MGKLVLSPTRTYLPVVRDILKEYRGDIHGMIHCSGGGQTKIMHFINQFKIVKDNLFETPILYRLIQEQSGTPWSEMYRVFNMGHRLEVYCPASIATDLISIGRKYGIDAQIIGRVEPSEKPQVEITANGGTYTYND